MSFYCDVCCSVLESDELVQGGKKYTLIKPCEKCMGDLDENNSLVCSEIKQGN